jgi:hypothetical protein
MSSLFLFHSFPPVQLNSLSLFFFVTKIAWSWRTRDLAAYFISPCLSLVGRSIMDDDYVAQVLAAEARDSSEKYSSQGLGAYMPRK